MVISQKRAIAAFLQGNFILVEQYLKNLPDEKIVKEKRTPQLDCSLDEIIMVLRGASPENKCWGILFCILLHKAQVLDECPELTAAFVEYLRANSELRQYFLRQKVQCVLPKIAWLGIHGTPEWESLQILPFMEPADIVGVHKENAIPLPDFKPYLRNVLSKVGGDFRVAQMVRGHPQLFRQFAKIDKDNIGYLYYCGLIESDDALSEMLSVHSSEWTLWSLMSIGEHIPTIIKNVLHFNITWHEFWRFKDLFLNVPLEELKVWHTHVKTVNKFWLDTQDASDEIKIHFWPDTMVNPDDLWAFVRDFYENYIKKGKMTIEQMQILIGGFHRRVREWMKAEEKMQNPLQIERRVMDIISSSGKHDLFCLFVLFGFAPYLQERILSERYPEQRKSFYCNIAKIIQGLYQQQPKIHLKVEASEGTRMVTHLHQLLNTTVTFHHAIAKTGQCNWQVIAYDEPIGSIHPLSFYLSFGQISVEPIQWQSTLFLTMHNSMVEPRRSWEESAALIGKMLEEHTQEKDDALLFVVGWIYICTQKNIVQNTRMKQFIQDLPNVWRSSMKGSNIPQNAKELIRTLFEDDESKDVLKRLKESADSAVAAFDDSSEFGSELGKRLRRAVELEGIAKRQVICCSHCKTIGGGALAKETFCCRKVLCGRCSAQVKLAKKCVCSKQGSQLFIQLNEADPDAQIENVF